MVQAYSIGKAQRDSDHGVPVTVGPGKYEVKLSVYKKVEPKWTMGSRAMFNQSFFKEGPGPSKYEIPSKMVEHPGISIGIKPKLNKTIDIPGPGQYSPVKKAAKIAFSIGMRYKQSDSKIGMPGPGQYEAKFIESTAPRAKIGTSTRISLSDLKLSPGPGSYDSDFLVKTSSAPKCVFGTAGSRDNSIEKLKAFIPGPGQYNSVSLSKAAPSTIISGKFNDSIETKEVVLRPGPGQYNPNPDIAKKAAPRFKIAKASREDLSKSALYIPAPNTYQVKDSFVRTQSAAWRFGSAKRSSLSSSVDMPAPNQYSVSSVFNEGPTYVIGLRTYDHTPTTESVPGPGQYNPTALLKKDPSVKIGKARRLVDLGESGLLLPGPANYSSLDISAAVKTSAPKCVFGTANSRDNSEEKATIPGPGAYNIKGKIGTEGIKVSLAAKFVDAFKERESRNIPGPAAYDTNTSIYKNAPAYKIGSSLRAEAAMRNQTPDPFTYLPKDTFVRTSVGSVKFGTSKRDSLAKDVSQLPGPGQYSITTKDKAPPKFAMGVRYSFDKNATITPGPLDYSLTDINIIKSSLPAFTLAGKYTTTNKDLTPGPGQYSLTSDPLSKAAPKFGFGTAPKSVATKDHSPGPGAYRIPSKIADVPRYNMPNKSDEFKFI